MVKDVNSGAEDTSSRVASGVRILHLEDSALDAGLILDALEERELACALTHALNRSEFESAIERESFDIILCDNALPGYSGVAALEFARKHQPQVPVIILTGTLDDAQAVQIMKNGATDYILKERMARLVPAIHRALNEVEQKKKFESALLQAPRTASVENPAEGIVHDLNNALSPVLLCAGLLETCQDPAARRHYVDLIRSSVKKATRLARQILRFPAKECAEIAETPNANVPLPAGHGELILLIEDEEDVRQLTATCLENSGYRVVTAHNGVEGIARFKENRDLIQLVVTDTDMPVMNGLTAVLAIKELQPALPVIIASGSEHSPEESQRIEAGHMIKLVKPYSVEQLLVRVDTAIHT